MKKGFLAAHARHDPGTSTAAAAANGQARDLLDDTPQQHPAKPHEPTGAEAKAAAADVRQSANWQQCLELLRSDVDEKKFVGLLLVTKLLPQGDDAAVQAVLDAVGFAFLQRLLLPLQQQQQQQLVDADKLQQQHLSVVLGLSILSAACRLPDVAGSDDVLQLVPLLLKVAAAGGVAYVLQPVVTSPAGAAAHAQQDNSWVDLSAEVAAAVDALECVVACAISGSYQQSVVLESNGFLAAVAALQAALAALQQHNATAMQQEQVHQQQQQPGSVSALVAAALQQIMLSVQLLSLLLGSEAAAAAAVHVQQDCPQGVAAAVMLLARVFGGTLPSNTSGSSSSSSSSGPDLAALQLQAQHALLLLLPLPEDSPAAKLLAHSAEAAANSQQQQGGTSRLVSAAAAVAGDWPAALRHGLCQVMRSRVGAVQRHSALRLAAACLELLGPSWLLPQQQQQQGVAADAAVEVATGAAQHQFLTVLMEMLAIETPLLLSDAMNPGAAVPREDVAMTARQPAAPSTSADEQQQQQQQQQAANEQDGEASDDDSMELDEQAQAEQQQQQQPPLSVQQVLQQVQQQEAQAGRSPAASDSASTPHGQGPPGFQQQQKVKSLQQQLAELQLPAEKAPGPGQQVAGQRAAQCLPACYQLLEGCLEVLVQQVGLLEQLADIHAPEPQHHASSSSELQPQLAAAGGSSVRAVQLCEVLPVLGQRQVEQLMARLLQVTEVICEFLEHAAPAAISSSSGSSSAAIDPLLTVGAVRVLGRFLADVPDAHQESLQKLLPQLLVLTIPGQDQGLSGSSAVCFLLPALLCWTAPSNDSQQQWAAVLLDPGNRCLLQLAGFAGGAAAAAAALAGSLAADGQLVQDSRGVDELSSLESQLGTACQVLQQLLAGLPAARARQQQQQSAAPVELQEEHFEVLAPLLQQLSSWAAVRRQQQQQQAEQKGSNAYPAAVGAAAVFLQSLQAVCLELPVVLPAAAVTGQLLALLSARPGSTGSERGGVLLLAWSCEAGWSFQLCSAWQQQQQQQQQRPAGKANMHGSRGLGGLQMERLQDAWLSAELSEAWDACLSHAAELLVEGRSGSLLQMLEGAAWMKAAALALAAVDAIASGRHRQVAEDDAAAQVVLEDSMAVQLLARAVSRV